MMVLDLFKKRGLSKVLFTHRRYKKPGRAACCFGKRPLSIMLCLGCELSVRGAASLL